MGDAPCNPSATEGGHLRSLFETSAGSAREGQRTPQRPGLRVKTQTGDKGSVSSGSFEVFVDVEAVVFKIQDLLRTQVGSMGRCAGGLVVGAPPAAPEEQKSKGAQRGNVGTFLRSDFWPRKDVLRP